MLNVKDFEGWVCPRSTKDNGREPKSCFGRVFNFKLGCFVMCTIVWPVQAQTILELKTRPRFCPVSLSLPCYANGVWAHPPK